MGRVAKILIITMLIGSAMLVADLSAASSEVSSKCFSYYEVTTLATDEKKSEEKDSEFWSKFRESVMPDDADKGKGKIPNYEKPPSETPPEHHQPPPPRH